MPRREDVLTVFVASPSDVKEERSRLEDVIRELNVTWSRELGVRLDLVRWETHAFPGIGDDAQDVINEEIPDDYDLFVGIMWCRYGTPTNRSGSGTVEEFDRAKSRYHADPSSVRLMVYFKDEPKPPSQIDPFQLDQINAFRATLGDEGTLYWTFTSVEDFEKLIRLHLTRQVQTWRARFQLVENTQVQTDVSESNTPPGESGEADLGILDLQDVFEERFAELKVISERIANATSDLTMKISAHTENMNALSIGMHSGIDSKAFKRLISKTASDMEEYTARVEAELPFFRKNLNDGMNALIEYALLYGDFGISDGDSNQLDETILILMQLGKEIDTAQASMGEFRQTIYGLPRITSEMNKAKRGVVSVLDELISELSSGKTLIAEGEKAVRKIRGGETD